MNWRLVVSGAVVLAGGLLWSLWPEGRGTAVADEVVAIAPEPVETDMHEFMEYLFEPGFSRLKPAMAQQPADNKTWKTIKAESIVLAEGGNLLLARTPEESGGDWNRHAVAVRTHGKALYTAGRKKDFAAARPAYEAMITSCNACHTQFADGEHMLTP